MYTVWIPFLFDFWSMQVRRREKEEMEREQLSELQDRKEAEELAKLETRGILSLASKPPTLMFERCTKYAHLLLLRYCKTDVLP